MKNINMDVPGTIIAHSPHQSGLYIGSPSIAVLPNGNYVVSHDFFGPSSNEHTYPKTFIHGSSDNGQTWHNLSVIENAFWHGLFVHNDILYIMGTSKHHGDIVIRKSSDGGRSWSNPTDRKSGLITHGGQFHTSAVPVVNHNGKLWRAFEDASGGHEWGMRYKAGMMSIQKGDDLLDGDNWQFSNFLYGDTTWMDSSFNGWLEGNAVVSPAGDIVNVIRTDSRRLPEKAAVIGVSSCGKESSFKVDSGLINMPGAAKKFTIHKHDKTGIYYSLSNVILSEYEGKNHPMRLRNTLALISSNDLIEWNVVKTLLHHEDHLKHGFQYVDWTFNDDVIIAVSRTAYMDDFNGVSNSHDANFLTFHKWTID